MRAAVGEGRQELGGCCRSAASCLHRPLRMGLHVVQGPELGTMRQQCLSLPRWKHPHRTARHLRVGNRPVCRPRRTARGRGSCEKLRWRREEKSPIIPARSMTTMIGMILKANSITLQI